MRPGSDFALTLFPFFSFVRNEARRRREKSFLKTLRPSPETPVVVGKAYEFSLWMIQKVENFPRSFRFSVGDRLVATALDVQLRLVDAAYARDNAPILTNFHDYWCPTARV